MIEPTTESNGAVSFGADETRLQHVTVEYDAEIAVRTMFPRHLEEDEVASKRLTASGDSFVALEDAR